MMQWPTLTSFLFATSFLPIKTFISTVEVLHPKVSKITPQAYTGMIVTVTGVGGGQPWKPDSMSNLGITSAATAGKTPSAAAEAPAGKALCWVSCKLVEICPLKAVGTFGAFML